MRCTFIFMYVVGSAHAFLPAYFRTHPTIDRTTPPVTVLAANPMEEDGPKRTRKLKKALKRIAELRRLDYLTLTTDQRVKVHSEPEICGELEELMGQTPDQIEVLRFKLQDGLEPMAPSEEWTFERSKARAQAKARERSELESALGVKPKSGVTVRQGDWRCPSCGAFCFASSKKCFQCQQKR